MESEAMSKFSLPQDKESDQPPVDPKALEAFAAGAKDRTTQQRPWDKHDPDALPRYNVSVRLNDYHLEMIRYLSETLDMSQHKILRNQVLPAIERLAERAFAEPSSGSKEG